MTYTYVTMDLSRAAYDEIAAKMRAAGYDHAFHEENRIDMHGIAVIPLEPVSESAEPRSQGLCETTLTERFHNPNCKCDTYVGNLGPCRTFEAGMSGNCVYCEHDRDCHDQIAAPAPNV